MPATDQLTLACRFCGTTFPLLGPGGWRKTSVGLVALCQRCDVRLTRGHRARCPRPAASSWCRRRRGHPGPCAGRDEVKLLGAAVRYRGEVYSIPGEEEHGRVLQGLFLLTGDTPRTSGPRPLAQLGWLSEEGVWIDVPTCRTRV